MQDDVQKVARLAIVPDGQNPNVRDIFSTGSGRADFQVQAQRSFLDIDRKNFSRYRRKDVCRHKFCSIDTKADRK